MNKQEEHILLKTTSIIEMCDVHGKLLGGGTCFFCQNSQNTIYFVTNNHVIEKSNYCYLYLSINNQNTNTGKHEWVFCNLENKIKKHPQYDLCVIDFTEIYNNIVAQNKTPIITCIPISTMCSNYNNFNHIEEIYMVGYPNEIINGGINYPIVRKGITATGICDSLNGTEAFIIDIPVYGGSSGSPVYFLTKEGKVSLVGITAEKYYEKNYVYIKDDNTNNYIKNKNQYVRVPNGLGYAIKANIILDLIDK